MSTHNEIARRIENELMERFDRDKRKVIAFADKRCRYYAQLCTLKQLSGLDHTSARLSYKVYGQIRFAVSYWLSLDEAPIDSDYDDLRDW